MNSLGEKVMEGTSAGINPVLHDIETMVSSIQSEHWLVEYSSSVEEIYFYGAGCSDKEMNHRVEVALKGVFIRAHRVEVEHDVKAAALATAGGQEGIVCILGTGSNACYFNGKDTVDIHPSLGYILADEGSGNHIGKCLLVEYFYGRMPQHLRTAFELSFDLNRPSVLKHIYTEKRANAYLANYASFAGEYITDPFISDLVYECLAKFAVEHIQAVPRFDMIPVHFVGSIAHHFRGILEEVAEDHSFNIGRVIEKPIDGLYQSKIAVL